LNKALKNGSFPRVSPLVRRIPVTTCSREFSAPFRQRR
jgi:hypothetical protein